MCEQARNIVEKLSTSFKTWSCKNAYISTMPLKADYWKNFRVEGVTATCLIEGCYKPLISLGAKKRISKKVFDANFPKMRGGRKPFGIFPKIHPIWRSHPSLSIVLVSSKS